MMASPLSHPVVVIGAGASGLTAVKSCLEEKLDVICYEMTDNIGGLWRYREEVCEGVASVMKSTIINTSKEMTAFSDFPPPDHFPNFMHNTYLVKYLELYTKHFNLQPHIRLRHKVLTVKREDDHWLVTVLNQDTLCSEVIRASAVMICTGHHSYPNNAAFKGLDKFEGKVIHSHSYRHFKEFVNKRIVVVGIGNSGGDLAVELSHVASKVYLSSRRGSWVMPRMGDYGEPIDLQLGRRYIIKLLTMLPDSLRNWHAALKLNGRYDHTIYNLKPEHNFYSQHPMVNDELPGRLLSGAVVLKGDIRHFTSDGVVFDGGPDNLVHPIDAVLLATGYDIRFPFLDPEIVAVNNNRVSLYRHVFPPSYPTLAFIGLVQPFGPLPPICELQSRWAVQVFLHKCQLPHPEKMLEHISETQARHDERYVQSKRHTIEVDGIPYMDEIAAQFDVLPHYGHLCLTDWALFRACVFGPTVSYHYRLNGPNTWKDAREAILNVQERVLTPLNTRLNRNLKKIVSDSSGLQLHRVFASIFLLGLFLFMAIPI